MSVLFEKEGRREIIDESSEAGYEGVHSIVRMMTTTRMAGSNVNRRSLPLTGDHHFR